MFRAILRRDATAKDQYETWLSEHLSREPERPLYHYSSYSGFDRFLDKRYLSATNIHYFNDTEELKHGLYIATNEIATFRQEGGVRADEFCAAASERIPLMRDVVVFAYCLSTEGDLLSQWRGYCHDGGVAIGFDAAVLRTMGQPHGFMLAPCIYDDNAKGTAMRSFILNYFNRYIALREEEPEAYETILASEIDYFAWSCVFVAALFKHPSFQEEHEWRLVSMQPIRGDDKHIEYWRSGSLYTPFYKLQYAPEKGPIELASIIQGPTKDADRSLNSLWSVLPQKEVSCKDVRKSEIPYRT